VLGIAARSRAESAGDDEAALRGLLRKAPGLTVLTGGQTGVDTIAAQTALRAGLAVHLVLPLGLRQEDSSLTTARQRRLAGAAIHELGSASFRHRTWTCVDLADAVLLLDPAGGAGCRETVRAARALGRPLLQPAPGEVSSTHITRWLAEETVRVFMVAGCRASVLARQAGANRRVHGDLNQVITGAADWHDRLLGGRG
jgi:predicted Rossmann-fold nucleotide-binding protein